MIVPVTLALPCRVIAVDVVVGPEHGVTTLEDLVARGILARQENIEHLGDPRAEKETATAYLTWLFKLPERVVMDVIGTLWNKGHATVDISTGDVRLSEEAKERLSRRESLAADGELRPREFLFEPITGMILPKRQTRRPGETSIRFPLRPGIRETDIPPAELVASVQAVLRTERTHQGRVNVLKVGFGSPALPSSAGSEWIEVDVAAHRDPDSDRVSLAFSETTFWSVRAQRRLSAFFDQLATETPDHPVVQSIVGRAQVERTPPENLDDLFRRMAARLADLDQVPVRDVQERHRLFSRWSAAIQARLTDMRKARAKVSLITRPEGHAWALTDLIDSARTQVVLVVPDPDVVRVREVLPSLRQALDRGVQLVFLWGQSSNHQLAEQVEIMLDELTVRPGARVVSDRRSAQTEACLVIQDDCRAIVASHSQLGRHVPGPTEIAVLVEPAENGPEAPRAVADLLDWTRNEFPRWTTAQTIVMADSRSAPAAEALPPVVGGPADPMSEVAATEVDASALALWAAGWQEVYAALVEARTQLVAKDAVAEVLRDAEHRAVLWEGLHTARSRLVLSDDRIDARTANSSMARVLRERRAASAEVFLAHPDVRANRGLEDFAGLGRGASAVTVKIQAVGGRVLVADDQFVLGSYSPLADHYGTGAGRRVTRIGIRVRQEGLAAEVAALLGARPRPADDSVISTTVPVPRTLRSAADAALPLLLAARAASRPVDFGPLAVHQLRAHDDPFAVVSALRDSEVPDNDLRRIVAAALRDGLGSERDQRTWTDWLVVDAWARDAYVEAALLAGRAPGHKSALRSAAVVAVALEAGPLTEPMAEHVFLCDDDAGANAVCAAVTMADVLLWGGSQGRDFLGLLQLDAMPAWGGLAARVERFGAVPLPLSTFAADQTRAEAQRELDQRRAEIVRDIDKLERLRNRFSFDAGTTLHTRLFRGDGLLDRIRAAAATGGRECRILAPDLPDDVRDYLDAIVADARENRMEWLRHVHFLHHIEEIVRSLRVVAAGVQETELLVEPRRGVLAECAELGRWLIANWDRLYAEARQLGRPYELPLLRLLTLLGPMMAWTKEQP